MQAALYSILLLSTVALSRPAAIVKSGSQHGQSELEDLLEKLQGALVGKDAGAADARAPTILGGSGDKGGEAPSSGIGAAQAALSGESNQPQTAEERPLVKERPGADDHSAAGERTADLGQPVDSSRRAMESAMSNAEAPVDDYKALLLRMDLLSQRLRDGAGDGRDDSIAPRGFDRHGRIWADASSATGESPPAREQTAETNSAPSNEVFTLLARFLKERQQITRENEEPSKESDDDATRPSAAGGDPLSYGGDRYDADRPPVGSLTRFRADDERRVAEHEDKDELRRSDVLELAAIVHDLIVQASRQREQSEENLDAVVSIATLLAKKGVAKEL